MTFPAASNPTGVGEFLPRSTSTIETCIISYSCEVEAAISCTAGRGEPWIRGDQIQAIGRSRGGRTTKILAVVDGNGRPIAFEVTPGQFGNVRAAIGLLTPLPPAALCAADATYDSKGLRQFLIGRGTLPVIPNNPTHRHPRPFNRKLYRERNVIERMFCRLKDWRRIATRYYKLASIFDAAVHLAVIWWT
jgi:transposase